LKEYEQSGNVVTAHRLTNLLEEERRKRWLTAMKDLDFMHSSRRSWALLRKLEGSQPVRNEKGVRANDISNIFFKTSNIKPNKQEKSQARTSYARELKLRIHNSTNG